MERKLLTKKLLKELEVIEGTTSEVVKKCDLSIAKCRELISTFKKEVSNLKFKTVESEIDFFKSTKQIL